MKITRGHDEIERRLRDALRAQADAVEPRDGWPAIVDRLQRRPSPWSRLARRPVVLAGAVAVAVLLGIAALTQLGGDGDDRTQVDVVNPPSAEHSLIAVTHDGKLVELDAGGEQRRVIDERFLAPAAGVSPSLPWPLAVREGDAAAGRAGRLGDVLFLAEQPASQACDGGSQVLTGLDLAPIDGQEYDRDPRPVIDPATMFALAPDGRRLVAVSRMEGFTGPYGYPADPRCGTEPLRLQLFEHAGGPILNEIEIPEDLTVRQLAWLDDDRLAVAASEVGGTPDVETLTVEVVDLSEAPDALRSDRSGLVAIPGSARMVAAADGRLVLAGPLDDRPFDDVLERTGPEGTGPLVPHPISIWVGDPATGAADRLSQIHPEDPGPSSAADGLLTVVSLAAAPDGSVLTTVASTDAWLAGEHRGVADPADVALFRIAPDGGTEKLADGILAVTVRAGAPDTPAPPPDDDTGDAHAAGPVVAARRDGSLVRLDPDTGEVAEELVVDDDFPVEGRLAGTSTLDGHGITTVLGQLAVQPDGTVLQARPTPVTADCGPDQIRVPSRTWVIEPGQEPEPLLGGGAPSGHPTLSPAGDLLAYVTTSDGEPCDGAAVVTVAEVEAGGASIATHTLPVGVVPTDLTWAEDDRLLVTLPAFGDAGSGEVVLIPVDPRTGGPVSIAGEPLFASFTLAPGASQGYVRVIVGADGTTSVTTDSDPASDVKAPPSWTVEIAADEPGVDAQRPAGLAEDGAGTVWLTITDAAGEPAFASYRIPVTDRGPGRPEPLGGDLVGITAAGATEPDPATEAGPTTIPDDGAQDVPFPGFIYVDTAGRLYHRGPDDVSGYGTYLADGFLPTGYLGDPPTVDPDGTAAYLTRWPQGAGVCEGEVVRVGLPGSPRADVGAVDVLVEGAWDPAISPEGDRLAYVEVEPSSPTHCRATVVVRDLDTGEERRWQQPAGEELTWTIHRPRFLSEGRLVVQRSADTNAGFTVLGPGGDGELVELDSQECCFEFAGVVGGTAVDVVATEDEGRAAVPRAARDSFLYLGRCGDDVDRCEPGTTLVFLDPIGGGASSSWPGSMDLISGDWGPAGLLAVSAHACPQGQTCTAFDLVHVAPGAPADPIPLDTKVVTAAWLP